MSKKFKYMDIRSLQKLLGVHYPFDVYTLAKCLDEYFISINNRDDASEDVKYIPDRLLLHNIKRHNRPRFDLMPIDVNFLHIIDVVSGRSTTKTQLRFRDAPDVRRKEDQRAVLHIQINYSEGTRWLISLPLQAIIKGWGDVEAGYMGYSHSIALFDKEGKPLSGNTPTGLPMHQHYYYGITSRNWLKRMAEHLAEMKSGSNKVFHKAWREYQGRSDVGLASELVVLNLSYEEVMAWEELMVDECMKAGTSLNMIPGGFKGMSFLHKHRITDKEKINLDERDEAIAKYAKSHPRLGIPNLLIAELWKDDEYASKIICGSENRLNVDQVRAIRSLNEQGLPIEKITEKVQAKSLLQVQRVLEGKTYSRIH